MWRSLFGGYSKTVQVSNVVKTQNLININKSINDLRDAQKLLQKREIRMGKKAKNCAISAKRKLEKSNRKGAIYDLKRKKMLDKELSMIQNKMLNLERQMGAIGTAEMNSTFCESIKEGIEALRSEKNDDGIEDVKEVMEELSELRSMQDAIDKAFSRDLNNSISDSELLKELEELENGVCDFPEAPTLPKVSDTKLALRTHLVPKLPVRSRRAPHTKDKSINSIPLDKLCYKRSNAKGKDIDIRPVSKKRKLRDVDLHVAEQELSTSKKKKRSGFSFPKGLHFPAAARREMTSELLVKGARKAGRNVASPQSKKPMIRVLNSGEPIQNRSTSSTMNKEEAANLALLETLYD